jgi:regulator of RNase E activity RraA
MTTKQPLGKLPRDAIGMLELPRLPDALLAGFRELPDLTGMSADAMDELGISGAVPAALLQPSDARARIVGRALTVHNVRCELTVAAAVAAGVSRLGEIEAHNLAERGDVLVLQGVEFVSNVGGLSATIGRRQGEIGAIVDGGVRDIDHSREIGYPIWSRGVSPITGKWRIDTISVNKPVDICGVRVYPGDVVLADEVGVCFVPRQTAADVLARAQRIAANEAARHARIAANVPVADLVPKKA